MAVPKVARLLALAHPSGPARTRPGGPMLRATGLAPMFVRAASSGAAIHRLVVRRLATGAAAKSSTPCAMAWRLRPLPLPLPASPPRALVRRTPGSAARAAQRMESADLVSCIQLFGGPDPQRRSRYNNARMRVLLGPCCSLPAALVSWGLCSAVRWVCIRQLREGRFPSPRLPASYSSLPRAFVLRWRTFVFVPPPGRRRGPFLGNSIFACVFSFGPALPPLAS